MCWKILLKIYLPVKNLEICLHTIQCGWILRHNLRNWASTGGSLNMTGIIQYKCVLTSANVSPIALIASTSLTLQPSMNSAVSTLWKCKSYSSNICRTCPKKQNQIFLLMCLSCTTTINEAVLTVVYLGCHVPEDLRYIHIGQIFEIVGASFTVLTLMFKVQLLSQSAFQILNGGERNFKWGQSWKSHYLFWKLPMDSVYIIDNPGLTLRTQLKPNLGCIQPISLRRISSVLMSPVNRSLRSMYCT